MKATAEPNQNEPTTESGVLSLFPHNSRIDRDGHLWLGGCDACILAETFGTPLYVFENTTLRSLCRTYRQSLATFYPAQAEVAYAGKAYLNLALAQLLAQEGLNLDVVSGGELYVARRAGFPAGRIHFHGNNKQPEEINVALDEGVGRIVVDNFHDLDLLEAAAAERRTRVSIWLRLSPGVDVHTHQFQKTGLLDSKFGFPLATGDAERALARACPYLDVMGLHTHVGSQVVDVEPLVQATQLVLEFAADMKDRHGFHLQELCPGGGWGVAYEPTETPPNPERYVQAISKTVVAECANHRLALPRLILEPGRSIVAPAGVALYRVGARKEIVGLRTYVSVDGGMADNVRPALYGARYTALVANKSHLPADENVTIVGRCCESGDVLIRDITLPRLEAGDLLAIPMAGAYCLSMAGNYNLLPRPAVVLLASGRAHLIQRRETYADLAARDLPLPSIEPA